MASKPVDPILVAQLVAAVHEHGTISGAALALGLPRATAQSRWNAARLAALHHNEPAPTIPAPEPKPAPEPEDLRATRGMKDEIARLRKELATAHRTSLFEESALEIMRGMAETPVAAPPNWLGAPAKVRKGEPTPEVPVTNWSDWHYGERVSATETTAYNAFDVDIANARIDRLVANTINLCREHHSGNYPGIVVNLGGDFISGGLHPELAKSDEQSRIKAALSVRDILVEKLTIMADEFGNVFCPAVPGNHGRNTQKPEFKGYVETNFDWMIYQLLARHFENDKRVRFLIPDSGDAYYTVYGKRILLTHGDMLGVKGGDGIIGAIGPIMRGTVKVRSQSSALGQPHDLMLLGHWHQTLWLPNAYVNNSLKGFDEYAAKALRALPTPPSQMLFFVHPRRGVTAKWEVFVDEPTTKPAENWVSWKV